jgi:hypothetical protein
MSRKAFSLHFDLNNPTLLNIKAYLEELKISTEWLSVSHLDEINEVYLEKMWGYESIDKTLLIEIEDLWQQVYNSAHEQ